MPWNIEHTNVPDNTTIVDKSEKISNKHDTFKNDWELTPTWVDNVKKILTKLWKDIDKIHNENPNNPEYATWEYLAELNIQAHILDLETKNPVEAEAFKTILEEVPEFKNWLKEINTKSYEARFKSIKELGKKLFSKLPTEIQDELKKYHEWWEKWKLTQKAQEALSNIKSKFWEGLVEIDRNISEQIERQFKELQIKIEPIAKERLKNIPVPWDEEPSINIS